MRIGLTIRFWSLWVGVHYSKYNKRFCINILPMVTIWVTKKGGIAPDYKSDLFELYQKFLRLISRNTKAKTNATRH